MKTHKRTVHENKKPLKCEICQSFFSSKGNLIRHTMTVHEKGRPFKCEICQRHYGRKEVLKTHQRTVHENKRRKFTFRQKGKLRYKYLIPFTSIAFDSTVLKKHKIQFLKV